MTRKMALALESCQSDTDEHYQPLEQLTILAMAYVCWLMKSSGYGIHFLALIWAECDANQADVMVINIRTDDPLTIIKGLVRASLSNSKHRGSYTQSIRIWFKS